MLFDYIGVVGGEGVSNGGEVQGVLVFILAHYLAEHAGVSQSESSIEEDELSTEGSTEALRGRRLTTVGGQDLRQSPDVEILRIRRNCLTTNVFSTSDVCECCVQVV